MQKNLGFNAITLDVIHGNDLSVPCLGRSWAQLGVILAQCLETWDQRALPKVGSAALDALPDEAT